MPSSTLALTPWADNRRQGTTCSALHYWPISLSNDPSLPFSTYLSLPLSFYLSLPFSLSLAPVSTFVMSPLYHSLTTSLSPLSPPLFLSQLPLLPPFDPIAFSLYSSLSLSFSLHSPHQPFIWHQLSEGTSLAPVTDQGPEPEQRGSSGT